MAGHGLNFDASNQLCPETENPCSDDIDFSTINDQEIGDGSEPSLDLPLHNEENLAVMIEREKEYLPKEDYLQRLRSGDLDMGLRREALEWIWKAHLHYGFGEPSFCLAINYLDRFLSFYELPKRDKAFAAQLLAVACLSLAVKMEELKREIPLIDLQVGEPTYVFEGKTIQRMELLLLDILKWKTRNFTPCKYIDYFLRKINGAILASSVALTSRSNELILSTVKGIDFLEFRPSEIAAAVAMNVSGEIQTMEIGKAMSCFMLLEKERVLKCLELIEDLTVKNRTTKISTGPGSLPQSPSGVLEAAACLSYKTEERTVGSCPSSPQTSPETKRRKLDKTNNY